jgi:hypothetical protein
MSQFVTSNIGRNLALKLFVNLPLNLFVRNARPLKFRNADLHLELEPLIRHIAQTDHRLVQHRDLGISAHK